MSFQLMSNESVSQGIKRSVRNEIEESLDQLRTHDQEDETVHETRKSFKKVRSALRLVRDDLGDSVYHRENYLFRDAARPLTEVRDAKIFVEVLDKLTEHFAAEIESGKYDKVREALFAKQQAVAQRVLKDEKACLSTAGQVAPVLNRMQDWTIDRNGWSAMKSGLKRTYRAGHRALSAAASDPKMENFHEWRKQAKYLWHELQLLESAWIDSEKDLADEVHNLTQLLGDDHDLAVLRWIVSSDPMTYGGEDLVNSLIPFMDRRREDLERQAFACGRHIYRDSPKAFTNRIKAGWKRFHTESAEPVKIYAGRRRAFAKRLKGRRRASRSKRAGQVRIFAWPARSALSTKIKEEFNASHTPMTEPVKIFAWSTR